MKTDVNYRSFVEQSDLRIGPNRWENPPDPLQYDDILKCSNCHRVVVDGITIQGGQEDCFDAVRGSNYILQNVRLHPNGGCGIVIKGAVYGWFLQNVHFQSHGRKADIEIGQFDNYWYPGRNATLGGTMNMVTSHDGQPVTVWLWNAEMPMVSQSFVKIRRVPWVVWFPYFCLRYVMIRLLRKKE